MHPEWGDSRPYQALSTLGPVPASQEGISVNPLCVPMDRPHTEAPLSVPACQPGVMGQTDAEAAPSLCVSSSELTSAEWEA